MKRINENYSVNSTYLRKTTQAKIFTYIVVRKIAKPRHPDVTSYEHPNSIVKFPCCEVMIHKKKDLQGEHSEVAMRLR